MKCFVRFQASWQMMLLGVGSLLIACIITAETTTSYLVAAGLAALVVRGEWIRRRRERDETGGRA
jgi:hypothetical protein